MGLKNGLIFVIQNNVIWRGYNALIVCFHFQDILKMFKFIRLLNEKEKGNIKVTTNH
jgi:hypothetical protein